MLFNTTQFWIFFFFVCSGYFATPWRYRFLLLIAVSYYFYMCWKPEYALLLMASTVVDYTVGQVLWHLQKQAFRKLVLTISILVNFGVLFLFKYIDFFSHSVEAALRPFNIFVDMPEFHWLLPVGISFYTFQSVSYTIDVYRRTIPAERNFGIYAAYVAFFPQLVAGPINRAPHLLPQFRERKHFTYQNLRLGLQLALWGMFKKVCIADLLAPVVTSVYDAPQGFTGPSLVIATFFFAIQIYCDFSGYSDIAIGIARIMGYDLATNFRQPYFSSSVTEFWQRWHISLSTWFRDYLYIPLGGSRVTVFRWCVNIMIVFVVSGLWHGANWTFLIWGALHGCFLVFEVLTRGRGPGARPNPTTGPAIVRHILKVLLVFLLVLVGWVFFRSKNVHDAVYILSHAHHWSGFRVGSLFALGLPRFEVGLAFVMIATLLVVDALLRYHPRFIQRLWAKTWFRWSSYAVAFYAIICFGVFEKIQFIYFQF